MPTEQELRENPDLEGRMELIRIYGDFPMAYSTLQPEMEYYDWRGGEGFIAYLKRGKNHVVLANPVTEKKACFGLVKEFIDSVPNCCFVQISPETREVLLRLGFNVTQLGIETEVNSDHFSLRGNNMEFLRRPYKKALKELEVKEVDGDLLPVFRDISNEWIRSKKASNKRELRFLTRPLEMEREEYVRVLAATRDGEVISYIVFDPIFSNNNLIGYYADILRSREDAPKGTNTLLMVTGMERFRQEGVNIMNLGLSPFYRLNNYEGQSQFTKNLFQSCIDGESRFSRPWLDLVLTPLFEYVARQYSFEGLGFNKSRFRGTEHPVFFAAKPGYGLKAVYDTFKVCQIL